MAKAALYSDGTVRAIHPDGTQDIVRPRTDWTAVVLTTEEDIERMAAEDDQAAERDALAPAAAGLSADARRRAGGDGELGVTAA